MNKHGLVDSHLHLQDFGSGTDIGALLDQGVAAGASHFVCNGTSEASWAEILRYARTYPQVIPCFGIHPWFIEECSQDWRSVMEGFLLKVPSGVGEIGLDRLREYSDRPTQEETFRAQLDIARRLGRPAMIHCVRAWGWLMEVLRREPRLPGGLLLHSYAGSADLVKELAGMGAYFSFSGKVLFDNYGRARHSLLVVPPDRLLIETDGPCMLPPEEYRPHKLIDANGKEQNHPANLPGILGGIANLLGESRDALEERLWHNARCFFGQMIDDGV